MSSFDKIECAVIGAGVIGLAVARELAIQGREVVILESEGAIGTGTSSRNSEVIHAGIYYPEGSLKARLCVRGKELLYSYCSKNGIDFSCCGKLIVATRETQIKKLEELQQKAINNGVHDMLRLNQTQVKQLEPHLNTVGALLSPSTGLIDTHSLMLSFLGEAEEQGAVIAFNSPVIGGTINDDCIRLRIGGNQPTEIGCDYVINTGGLYAQAIVATIEGFPKAHIPDIYFAKGNYFVLNRKSPFKRLIYPVPDEAGLGVHLTLDLEGQARFGPDVEWVDQIDYAVDPSRIYNFYTAIREYWPNLPEGSLSAAYSGIRPKLNGPENPQSDFVISGPETHNVQGLINLFGIESPGITASMALAEEVLTKLP